MEIEKLLKMIEDTDVDYAFRRLHDGYQIILKHSSIIQHSYSYGGIEDKLEVMGKLCRDDEDEVEGYLTAEEVFTRIMDWEGALNLLKTFKR